MMLLIVIPASSLGLASKLFCKSTISGVQFARVIHLVRAVVVPPFGELIVMLMSSLMLLLERLFSVV